MHDKPIGDEPRKNDKRMFQFDHHYDDLKLKSHQSSIELENYIISLISQIIL